MRIVVLVLVIIGFASCKIGQDHSDKQQLHSAEKKEYTKAEKLVLAAIEAHGGSRYDSANYSFVFRNKQYSFKNNGEKYTYKVVRDTGDDKIEDILTNDGLTRTTNGTKVTLSDKEERGYTGSLNSVIYFATLPHKLQDEAVHKSYKGTTTIKGQSYHVIEVTFSEEGGGQDHDDNFHYWINKSNNVIDYFAYDYQVSGGGVRFRTAYNSRNVGGIIFQDYVNYKAEIGTALADLPALWEKKALKELSKIETEQVQNLK